MVGITEKEIEEAFEEELKAFRAFKRASRAETTATKRCQVARHRLMLARQNKSALLQDVLAL